MIGLATWRTTVFFRYIFYKYR